MKPLSERIEIEKAFLEGKEVEFRSCRDCWVKLGNHEPEHFIFDWQNYDYRIKPEPRVIYVEERNGGLYGEWGHSLIVDKTAKVIRFIEDLEGD